MLRPGERGSAVEEMLQVMHLLPKGIVAPL